MVSQSQADMMSSNGEFIEALMKTVMLNNNVITLASTKEYSSENLEYFRFTSSPKAYFLVYLQEGKKMKKKT